MPKGSINLASYVEICIVILYLGKNLAMENMTVLVDFRCFPLALELESKKIAGFPRFGKSNSKSFSGSAQALHPKGLDTK